MRREPVALSAIAGRIDGELRGDGSATASDVTHDSHQADIGALFAAIRGLEVDGHAYVREATGRGAAAVLGGEVSSPFRTADKGA